MLREFNVHLEDVEMLGGADSLLEGTNVTKVVVRGDSKLSSLNSFLKNCSEIDRIEGELDLNGASSLDNAFKNTPLMNSVTLKNINNNEITSVSAFDDIEEVNVSGICSKSALQNIISSTNWNDEKFNYINEMADTITNKSKVFNDVDNCVIRDTLEQKAKGIEIIGQTYENLIVGNGEVTLLDELTLESIDGSPNEFNPHIEQPVCVEVVEGNTVQDESNIYSIGELQEDGTYKIDILTESTTLKGLTKGVGTQVTSKRFMIESKNGSWTQGGILASPTYKKLDTPYTVCMKVISKKLLDNNYAFAGSWLGSTNAFVNYMNDLEVGVVYKKNITPQAEVKEGDSICVFQFTNNAVNGQHMEIEIWLEEDVIKSETQLLIPQQLNKIGDIKDRFYWDEDKGHYCIEQNVSKELEVMASPNIIDLPHLNKKYSLDTYMPTTYLECTNSPVQPSRLFLESDLTKYKPTVLETDTDYTVQFECKEKSNKKIKLNLGGSEKEVDAIVGLNHVSITTPSELSKDKLFLSGVGNKVDNVMVVKGEMNQYPEYFEGIANAGELQDDGSYKIDILSNSEHICFEKNDCIPFVSGSIWYEDFLKNKIKVVPNEIYHAFVYSTDSDSFVGLQVRCYSKDGTFIKQIDTSAGIEPKDQGRFTVPQDCYYINFRIYAYEIKDDLFSSRKIILYKGNLNNVINSKDVILEKSKPISKLEILLSQPLAKDEKLYWSKSNKRYEIDRNGEIEVPIVEGDVIDLPRLYQREDTVLTIESGNIKPSSIKVEYLDID